MAEIARFHTWDGDESLLVPGTDPWRILADAVGELDEDEVILTPPDEVDVRWWRTAPCHPRMCDEAPHRTHYLPTADRTRGGFQAARLDVGYPDDPWASALALFTDQRESL